MEAKYLAGDVDLRPNTFTYNAVRASTIAENLLLFLVSLTNVMYVGH